AVLDVLPHGRGIEFGQRIAVSEDRRPVTVLPLHPPEVGGSVGLAGKELVDEALFVVVRDVVAPPGEVPLVADRGRGYGPERLAAGAAGPVGRIDLDVVGQGQEFVAQAGE